MSTATKTSPTNKELSGLLREAVNRLLESGASTEDVGPIDEAARRLEFGYTPPEQPPAKSALEEKRDQEKHEAYMVTDKRLKAAGLGGFGMFIVDQPTGKAYIYTSAQIAFKHGKGRPRHDYRSLSLVDDLEREFMFCENGDYGKKSFPAPVEE